MRRIPVSVVILLSLAGVSSTVGCGGTTRASSRPVVAAASTTSTDAEVRLLRQREQELAGRLALAEAEVVDLRAQLRDAETESRRRTVRIGRERAGHVDEGSGVPIADASEHALGDEGVASGDQPRPLLELVGAPPVRAVSHPNVDPMVVPPPPPGVEERLPVMALEGGDAPGRYARQIAARVAATPVSRLPPVPVDSGLPPAVVPNAPDTAPTDDVTAEYRAALELVHGRQLERALAALTVFIDRHSGHAHAAGARYWRAEVRYAQREYALALAGFEELLRLAPTHTRAPDALLKVGLCHQRMGDLARAHLVFQRLQRQFPDTEAARAASRQDAS